MATIDIDPGDFIGEISTEDLLTELKKRKMQNVEKNATINIIDTISLLDDSAQALKTTRADLSFRLESLKRFYRD